MRKLILLILSLFLFVFSLANYKEQLEKYYPKTTIEKVENYLNNWNKKTLKKQNPQTIYDKITKKIDILLQKKNLSEKHKTVLLYLKEKIINFKNKYLESIKKVQEQKKEEKNISSNKKENILKKLSNISFQNGSDLILVPIENKNYSIANLNMKALYGDSLLYSVLFKNKYGNEANNLIKKAYFIDENRNILAEGNFVNGVVYFNLKSAKLLRKDVSTRFYVVVSLNKINSLNNTNKRIKLELLKHFDSFDTKIVSVDNGNDTDFYLTNFYTNTYFIRKSKPIIKSQNVREKLHLGTNDIYSFEISSTGGDISLQNLIINSNISSKANVEKKNVDVLIDGKKYDGLTAYFDKERYDAKLYIKFKYPYTIGIKAKTFTIRANFTREKDKAYVYTRLEKISNENDLVDGNYTGSYSILRSDNAYKGVINSNIRDFYTDSLLDFSNVKEWYLKD